MLLSLSNGALAAALAAISIISWVAVGSVIRSPRSGQFFLDVALSILLGSTATSVGYALFSLNGIAKAGAAIVFFAYIGSGLPDRSVSEEADTGAPSGPVCPIAVYPKKLTPKKPNGMNGEKLAEFM